MMTSPSLSLWNWGALCTTKGKSAIRTTTISAHRKRKRFTLEGLIIFDPIMLIRRKESRCDRVMLLSERLGMDEMRAADLVSKQSLAVS